MKRILVLGAATNTTGERARQLLARAVEVMGDGGVLMLPPGWTWQVIDADDIEVRVEPAPESGVTPK